jgi:hypothetical protein
MQGSAMYLLATLLLAHFVADFPLQTDKLVRLKNSKRRGLLLHVLIHVVVTWCLLGFNQAALPLVTGIGVAHFIIDWLKLKNRFFLPPLQSFLFDQFAHILVLIVATAIVPSASNSQVWPVLPAQVLYPSLLFSIALGLMVMGWVWVNTKDDGVLRQSKHLQWGRKQLLVLEQRLGLGLLGLIGAGLLLQLLGLYFL